MLGSTSFHPLIGTKIKAMPMVRNAWQYREILINNALSCVKYGVVPTHIIGIAKPFVNQIIPNIVAKPNEIRAYLLKFQIFL